MEQNAFQWPALPLPKLSPRFRLAFLTACLVGSITHLYLFTNTLLNHDSIHSLFTDNNVLSSGRWSAQLLSSFSTFFQMPVVIGLISILALAVTAGLTVEILGLTHRGSIVMAAALLVTFPSLSGIFSYLFTADAYCLALLLNTLAVWCAKRYRRGWAAAIVMMAVACGTYQAFLSYAVGLFLFDCIFLLLEGEDIGKVVRKGLLYIGVCAASLVLYYAVLKAILLITHTELVDYQGLDRMGLDNILAFLKNIPDAYDYFFTYFRRPGHLNRFYRYVQMADCLFLVVLGLWLAVLKGLFRDLPRLLLAAAGAALVPLALNFVFILAVDAGIHHLMLYAFVLVFLLTIKIAELVMGELVSRGRPAWMGVLGVNLALCALLVWCGFYTNNISYLRLQVRYDNSAALANRIAARVESLEGYTKDTPVALIGLLPDDLYGRTIPAFSDPEPVTGTEDVLLEHYYSARDVLQYCAGLRLPPFTREQWDSVYYSDFIYDMPCWPAEGSVLMHNGVAVVKLGEIERP